MNHQVIRRLRLLGTPGQHANVVETVLRHGPPHVARPLDAAVRARDGEGAVRIIAAHAARNPAAAGAQTALRLGYGQLHLLPPPERRPMRDRDHRPLVPGFVDPSVVGQFCFVGSAHAASWGASAVRHTEGGLVPGVWSDLPFKSQAMDRDVLGALDVTLAQNDVLTAASVIAPISPVFTLAANVATANAAAIAASLGGGSFCNGFSLVVSASMFSAVALQPVTITTNDFLDVSAAPLNRLIQVRPSYFAQTFHIPFWSQPLGQGIALGATSVARGDAASIVVTLPNSTYTVQAFFWTKGAPMADEAMNTLRRPRRVS